MSERAKTTEEALKRAKENVMGALGVFDEQDGFDLVFECTGAEPCIQMSIHVSFFPISLSLSLYPSHIVIYSSLQIPGLSFK